MFKKNKIIIIPSRLGSRRFPNKPMYTIGNKPLLKHCYDNAIKSKKTDYVIVATPDKEIFNYVKSFGGIPVLTSIKHTRASDRCAEALIKFEKTKKIKFSIIAMLQGDEPCIKAKLIDKSFTVLDNDEHIDITNAISAVSSENELNDKNCIKVVFDKYMNALYFSRSKIPYTKFYKNYFYKQVCIITFKRSMLLKYLKMKPTRLEILESVDMNRLLENKINIRLIKTNDQIQSVDIKKDVNKVLKILNAS